jgi:hypothetical protein
MKAYQAILFPALAALLSGCAYLESLGYYGAEEQGSIRQTYGVTQDTGSRMEFPVTYRDVEEYYHSSHVEWVYQPHVTVPEPPVVSHGNP